MESTRLIKAREYYDRTQGGEDKKEVALSLYGRKNYPVEKSEEYLAIVSAANQVQKEELKKEIEQAKRKQLKAYTSLLDKGQEMMDEAENMDDKLKAQANQRANLTTGIVTEAVAWDGEDRNSQDLGNVLEGIVL